MLWWKISQTWIFWLVCELYRITPLPIWCPLQLHPDIPGSCQKQFPVGRGLEYYSILKCKKHIIIYFKTMVTILYLCLLIFAFSCMVLFKILGGGRGRAGGCGGGKYKISATYIHTTHQTVSFSNIAWAVLTFKGKRLRGTWVSILTTEQRGPAQFKRNGYT